MTENTTPPADWRLRGEVAQDIPFDALYDQNGERRIGAPPAPAARPALADAPQAVPPPVLTSEQVQEFRRHPGNFQAMVRAIYEAGWSDRGAPQAVPSDPWRDAVLDAAAAYHVDGKDAREILGRVIAAAVTIATDPRVSSDAPQAVPAGQETAREPSDEDYSRMWESTSCMGNSAASRLPAFARAVRAWRPEGEQDRG